MSLLDLLTGGQDANAKNSLAEAMKNLSDVKTPTTTTLTLPQLQQYVQAGIMTPAQAKAALIQSNAYNDISTDSKPVEAEMSALSQMQDIANSGGMDAQAKAKLAEAQNAVQTQEQGTNGAIMDQLAARGIAPSLMSAAMQSANNGQQAQALSMSGEQAASDAENRALAALQESGTLGGQIHGEQYNEAAQKAAAQNAISQWNAGTTTATNEANAGRTQAANAWNTTNAQDVSNKNTGNTNYRTEYNAKLPQQVFEDQFQKATGQAGVSENQANQAMQQGQQEAGLWGGLIGAAGNVGASAAAPAPAAETNPVPIYNVATGGQIPGKARVPGDSLRNDTVPARLSPGEVVIPRSIAPHPELAKRFVQHVMGNKEVKPAHPADIRSILDALTSRRAA